MYTKDELRELKIAFWESFAAYCEVQPYLQGRKKIWILYDTKIKGVELKFDATRNGNNQTGPGKETHENHRNRPRPAWRNRPS